MTITYPFLGITHTARLGSAPDFPRNVKIKIVAGDTAVISVAAEGVTTVQYFTVAGESNEPIAFADPAIVVNPDGSGGFAVELQADRLGNGRGRVYTLTATATDLAGNAATSTARCTVTHDQRK